MQRASPRKRKQVFPQGSPPGSPSKSDLIQVDNSPERRNMRRNLPARSWEEEQQMSKEAHEILDEDDSEEKIEVDHVEEVEEMEEEDVEVDDPVEEEVIEEYVDDFNIPLYAEDSHIIHGSGKTGGARRYVRDYSGGLAGGNYAVPRIHDGDSQFGGQMRRQMKYRNNIMAIPGPIPRPPVHLRTTDAVAQQPRARLLPVAVARPSVHHRYGQSYGGHHTATHWREDQKRKMELLDIYESLPVDKQVSFLNYLNQTGETFIPPSQRTKGRRSGEGLAPHQTITRMRALPNELDQHNQPRTVEVPAHMARGGGEILISPLPDGRNRIMSLIPVGDEETAGMERDKMGGAPSMKKRKEEEESREEEEEADTSDMPLLEADKEALEKRKEEGRRRRENAEWNGMEEDVDVENVEEAERRMEEGEDEEGEQEDGSIPMLDREVRGRRGLFYVPELDGAYGYEQRYQMCAPKMKGGLRLCESCNIYMRKSVFYHHQRTIREHGSCSAMTPKRFECGVPECDEKLPTIERLCVHMAEMHNMPTDVQETEFTNEDEFQAFLVELESKGGNFRMSRGNKCGKQGVVRYYRCNRVSNNGPRGRPRKSMQPPNEIEEGLENQGGDNNLEMEGEGGGGEVVEGRRKKQALVRTEKICTAFYRKAEGLDGRISVRYCDFHLHEDVKVKLPDIVKERIQEMLTKKLPMPVIVEVIKAESEQYARLGSELERRIYAIGEKDVRNVYCTYLAKRRKEESRGVQEEMGDLNETETRFLMAFEKAEGKSIHEVAKGSKTTLERRRRRDALRENVMIIHKFFKSDRFVEFSDAQLTKMEAIFGNLTDMVMGPKRERIEVVEDIMEDDIEEEEGERVDVDGTEMNGGEPEEEGAELEISQQSTSTAAAGETPAVRKRGRPRKHPLTVEEAMRLEVEKERREEQKEKEELTGVAKEEELVEEEIIRSPVVTSRGRLTKPKRFPGEY